MKKVILALMVAGLGVLMTSCSADFRKHNRYIKSGTIAEKDSAAYFFFNRGDFEKASYLYEELRGPYRGQTRGKDVMYQLAYCKFNQRLYVMAAYYFDQFVKLYPNDPRTEECAFQIAYCSYMESDPYYLDQQYTIKAIEQFQLFILAYSDSDKVEDANEILKTMRERLAQKGFEQAMLYFRVENHKAAVQGFQNMIRKYPDSRYREESQYMLFKSSFYLASNSIEVKKKNRYLDSIDWYQRFVDKYPSSVFVKEGEGLFARAKKSLGKIVAEEPSS